MDIHKIRNLLPHRYPFLLIDRVLECVPDERLVGIKNVSVNEPYFQGHFPQKPVMPGVLIIEAMAQATGLLSMETMPELSEDGALYYLVGVDKARFKRVVEPGDQIRLEANLLRKRRDIWFFSTQATVDGALAASAEIMCTSKVL